MSGSRPIPPGGVALNVVPKDWLDRSDDFEARLMRSGLDGTPVIEAPAMSALGASSALPMRELVVRLAGATELGERLAQLMYERKETPLNRALRSRFAAPVGPHAPEALAALVALLARSVHLDAARSVPLEVLAQLGPEGSALIPLLRQRLSAPASPPSAPEVQRLLELIESGIPYFERAPTLKALTPTSAVGSSAAGFVLPDAPVSRVGEVGPSAPAKDGPTVSSVLSSLSFGGAHALGLLAEELERMPPGPLAELLRAATPPGHALDAPSAQAAALLRVLWQYRDPADAGAVRWALFLEDAGPAGAELRARLEQAQSLTPPARPNYTFLAATLETLRLTLPPETAKRLADELVRRNGLIPTEVPSLDAMKKTVPAGALAGKGLIAVQHLFPTLVPLVEACIEKGMDPKCMHILGTPYSSNPLVAAYLRILGVDVMEGRDAGGSTRDFEEHRVREIGLFLEHVAASPHLPTNGWKLLDDGGLLQLAIAGHKRIAGLEPEKLRALFPSETTDAIEQTTRGLTELAKFPLRYRTVTVANAPGKIEEGGIIGWSLADALLHELRQTGRLDSVENITVVSAGTVGLTTARELRDLGFTVTVVDRDATKRALAEAAGFAVAADAGDTLPACDLIYACTGKTALDGHRLADWDGLIASGSSAAIEYNRDQINALRAGPIAELNRGRPMNFNGDGYENLAPAQIGLTRALLFAAIVQDTGQGPPETLALDSRRDALAVRAWKRGGGHEPPALSRLTPRAPAPSRPDALSGAARHDEWMAYLSSLPRAVCPPPHQVGFAPGLYFFQDEAGKVRAVRTQAGAGALSSSSALPLDRVPARVHTLSEREPPEWMVELGHGVERFVAPVKAEGQGGLSVGVARLVERLLHVARERDPQFHPSWGKKEARALLYGADGQLLYGFPGSSELYPRPRAFTGDALFVRLGDHTLVEVQKTPPAVSVKGLLGGGGVQNAFASYSVPPAFARIDAVAPLNDHGDYALVGRSHDGHLALAPLHAGPVGAQVALLPKDAVFRGMHRPSPETEPFGFVVDYTLPGDPVELEHLRHHPVRFNWSFWPGSV